MAHYPTKSYCGHCGEWKPKAIWCDYCGLRLRNKARNKRKPNKK